MSPTIINLRSIPEGWQPLKKILFPFAVEKFKSNQISGSPSKSLTDGASPNFRHKNTATEDDDGIYEGIECRNVATTKRQKSTSPIKLDNSNPDNRISDKATQTGMEEEEEERKKQKKAGNCIIL